MSTLAGARVALLEGRMSSELAQLIRRHGGEPYCVPAVREATLDCERQVAALIDSLTRGDVPIVVFLTGVGVTALLDEATRLGRRAELVAALAGLTTVCRGPKPAAVLKRHGVSVTMNVDAPYTSAELLVALTSLDLQGTEVALVHYGERNANLADALRKWGARLTELCLYEWLLPEDVRPLKELIQELITGCVDAIAFTSQVQVRHLFRVTTEPGQADMLARALNTATIVAAVGPTCATALRSVGVTPHVMPDYPKMGHMVSALAQYMSSHRAFKQYEKE
jgi:uroporphyrinogen-III synthase